jgi:hypothetical protein
MDAKNIYASFSASPRACIFHSTFSISLLSLYLVFILAKLSDLHVSSFYGLEFIVTFYSFPFLWLLAYFCYCFGLTQPVITIYKNHLEFRFLYFLNAVFIEYDHITHLEFSDRKTIIHLDENKKVVMPNYLIDKETFLNLKSQLKALPIRNQRGIA